MLSTTRTLVLFGCVLALLGCNRSPDAMIVGEWTCRSIVPESRVIYKSDHTYSAMIEGFGPGAGTWRTEANHIISRSERGESTAQILKLTSDELQLKGPDGIDSTYKRLK